MKFVSLKPNFEPNKKSPLIKYLKDRPNLGDLETNTLEKRMRKITGSYNMPEASAIDTALQNKSKDSGISFEKLKSIYLQGEKAYDNSDSPKVINKYQFAMGIVNNYIQSKK